MTHLSMEEHGKAVSAAVSAVMTHVGGGGVVPDAASSPGANPSARFVSMVLQSAVQVIEQLARGSEHSDHAAVHESYGNLRDAWLAVLRAEEDGSPPSDEESRVVSASLQHFIESYVSFGSAPAVYPALSRQRAQRRPLPALGGLEDGSGMQFAHSGNNRKRRPIERAVQQGQWSRRPLRWRCTTVRWHPRRSARRRSRFSGRAAAHRRAVGQRL